MKILLVEPFLADSHAAWAEGFQQFSQHQVEILSLPGRYWKWRMYGGAVSLARKAIALNFLPDLILATDMLDLTTFLVLCGRKYHNIPVALYFHENQITYPWSPADHLHKSDRNNQYGFINYTSALAADHIFFNSSYHRQSFINALPDFLKQFPDHRELDLVDDIEKKSAVLPLGMDLKKFDDHKISSINKVPHILWNHRWEYDKNPDDFFAALFRLKEEEVAFKLIVLGKQYHRIPEIFKKAREKLADNILHFGYADDFSAYAKWLWKADILPVTSYQDFFGGSVVEAMYCQTFPILPNRLAYPDHLSAEQCEVHLYDGNSDGLYKRLSTVLKDFQTQKIAFQQNNYVQRYDWRTLAAEYDLYFNELTKSG